MNNHEIDLAQLQVGLQVMLADCILDPQVTVEQERRPDLRAQMVYAFLSLAGQKFKRIERRVPADWWQAFKARWFPGWALHRWPVRERVLSLDASVFYPDIALPEAEHWPHTDFEDLVE